MPHHLTVTELLERFDRRELSCVEAVQGCLDRIGAVEDRVNAFLGVATESALAQAAEADAARQGGESGRPLLGVPVALKDNLAVKGQRLTCGSRILGDFVSPYDATVVTRLRQAGAVILGRTNMDEFAMGSSTEHSAFGASSNPWDLDRVTGGSSGGSAAAVAAEECPAALGSDTGGSIRQPAAFCGCVGLKPTYGRVSRYGLVAFASSLDQIGPFARTTEDAARLLQVLAGQDPRDATSVPEPVPDYLAGLKDGVKGLRIGLPRQYFGEGLDARVESAVRTAVAALEAQGAEMVEVDLPHTEFAVATYYLVATAEASSNLARFDGIRYGLRVDGKDPAELYSNTRGAGFGPEVKRRILLGTYALSSGYYDAYYLKAQKVRTLIARDFSRAFEKVDLIAGPTAPTPAFAKGEKSKDPLQMYLSDIYTLACNLAGLCGISLPCGFTEGPGLPVGLQLLGRPFDEPRLLRAAQAFEQATDWHRRRPELNP